MSYTGDLMDALNAKVLAFIYILTLFFCIKIEGGMGEKLPHTPQAYHSLNMGALVSIDTRLNFTPYWNDICHPKGRVSYF